MMVCFNAIKKSLSPFWRYQKLGSTPRLADFDFSKFPPLYFGPDGKVGESPTLTYYKKT